MENTTTEFGVYHLANDPTAFQPVRTNNFRFIVIGLDRLLKVGGDENEENDYITNAQEILDFSVVKFDVPHFKQTPIEVKRGNSKMKFAGVPEFNAGKLVINDFTGADGKSVLEAWQNCSYDVINDTIGPSNTYKVDAMVLEYTPDNKLIRYWELKGCWVSGLSESGFDAETSTKKTVDADITFDWAIPHKPEELVL